MQYQLVTHWFVAHQDFDIIEWPHVKGVDNYVPDSFSHTLMSLLLLLRLFSIDKNSLGLATQGRVLASETNDFATSSKFVPFYLINYAKVSTKAKGSSLTIMK